MRALPAILAVLLGTLGCVEEPPASDWTVYTEIVGRQPVERRDLPRCQALQDPALAGDCALTVALGLAEVEGASAHTRCAAVQVGLWQDECHFIAAERARSRGKLDAAIKLCESAGRFAPDCAFHLWQRAMRTLAQRVVLDDLDDHQIQMRRVHARWAARVGHISDFDSMFWRKLFRAVWDGVSRVDPAICTQLDPDLAERCRMGALIHLDHALRASLRNEAWTTAFCALQVPSISALTALPEAFPELDRFPTHPAHQAVVDAFHTGHCKLDSLPPHPDPPRRSISDRSAPEAQGRTAAPTQSR